MIYVVSVADKTSAGARWSNVKELRTEILIDAPQDEVWKLLTDFPRYPEWNPFIVEVRGELKLGNRLSIRIEPPGGTPMTFKPVLKRVEPPHTLRWLGRLIVPGLFDGEHFFDLDTLDAGGVRLRHGEDFGGLLVPLMWSKLAGPTQRGITPCSNPTLATPNKRAAATHASHLRVNASRQMVVVLGGSCTLPVGENPSAIVFQKDDIVAGLQDLGIRAYRSPLVQAAKDADEVGSGNR